MANFKSYKERDAIISQLDLLASHALAHELINERGEDAHAYCREFNVGRLGENVWHIILDDAIRMRRLIHGH